MARGPALPRPIPTTCPGREEAAGRLALALDQARAGHGGTWLITGPTGIGRSFLLAWLARRADEEGFTVLRVQPPERGRGGLGPFEEARRALRARAAPAPAAPAPAPGPRLLAFVEALHRAATERPVALLVDDLERADPEALGAFQALSRGMGGMRVVMVAALRSGGLDDGAPLSASWARTMPRLSEEGALESVELHGLPAPLLRELAEQAVGAPFPPPEGRDFEVAIEARTEGNPLFAQELIALLRQQGHLRRSGDRAELHVPRPSPPEPGPGGGWGLLPLPPSLRRLVTGRLAELDPADRAMLVVAALVGSPFGTGPLVGVLSLSTRGTVGRLEELRRRGLLRHEGEDEEEGWSFAHDLFWELLLREAPPEEVRGTARRLATWWMGARPEEVETIARLLHDAREPEEGLPWVRDAIDRALDAQATASAERLFSWYFDLLAVLPDRGPALQQEALRLVDGLLVRRLRRETVHVLDELARTHLTPELPWEVGWRSVHVLVSFDLKAAEARYRTLARDLARGGPAEDPVRRGLLAFLRCELEGAHLRWAEAVASGEEAVRLLPASTGAWLRGRLLQELAWGELMRGHVAASRAFFEQARSLAADAGTSAQRASLRVVEGTLALMEGNLRTAEQAYREAAPELLAVGGIEGYGVARNNQAEVLLHLGRMEEARAALDAAGSAGARFAYPRVLRGAAVKWAWLAALEGQWPMALARLDEAERIADESGFDEERWETGLLRAWSMGETGRMGEALALWEKVQQHEASLPPYVRPYLLRVRSRLLELSGRPGAKETLDRAVELAGRLGGPEGRRAFEREVDASSRRPPAESAPVPSPEPGRGP